MRSIIFFKTKLTCSPCKDTILIRTPKPTPTSELCPPSSLVTPPPSPSLRTQGRSPTLHEAALHSANIKMSIRWAASRRFPTSMSTTRRTWQAKPHHTIMRRALMVDSGTDDILLTKTSLTECRRHSRPGARQLSISIARLRQHFRCCPGRTHA